MATVQKYIAILLVLSILGLACPAMAADMGTLNLPANANVSLFPKRTTFGAAGLALAPPQSSQSQNSLPQQTQAAPSGGLTKGGKVMLVIGAVVAGAGAIMIAKGGSTEIASTSTATTTTTASINWRTTGYIWVGSGAVLALIGLTRHQH